MTDRETPCPSAPRSLDGCPAPARIAPCPFPPSRLRSGFRNRGNIRDARSVETLARFRHPSTRTDTDRRWRARPEAARLSAGGRRLPSFWGIDDRTHAVVGADGVVVSVIILLIVLGGADPRLGDSGVRGVGLDHSAGSARYRCRPWCTCARDGRVAARHGVVDHGAAVRGLEAAVGRSHRGPDRPADEARLFGSTLAAPGGTGL
jgi:hypothetical protein